MATTQEQLTLLEMLQHGEITVEEAFELLDAYRRHDHATSPRAERPRHSLRPGHHPRSASSRLSIVGG